ncbi:MAG TPA: LuxR family transcriptional regulator [Pararhizobium sp.]|nr:LuxR family transcriptional regulator [Pararhizobium sp.]
MNVPVGAERRKEETKAFLGEIETLQTQFDVFRLLKRVCELFGFSAFMVMRLPDATAMAVAEQSVINNWPTEMIAAYDRLGLLQSSPAIAAMRNSVKPLAISLEERTAASPEDSRAASEALFRQFGFLRSVAIPVHDARGDRGVVFFDGDRETLCHTEMLELNMLAIHIYERLQQIAHTDARDVSPLTDRETNCLAWTAEGKTSNEIAEILGLSEHTVNHYLNRAARKLSTVNRTQAVAKALRRGWIK